MPPSQRLKVPPLKNDWAAYQFDQAVGYLGAVIDNALQERNTLAGESWPKYTIQELLSPDFRLQPSGPQGIKAMAAAHPKVVGRWKQVAKAS